MSFEQEYSYPFEAPSPASPSPSNYDTSSWDWDWSSGYNMPSSQPDRDWYGDYWPDSSPGDGGGTSPGPGGYNSSGMPVTRGGGGPDGSLNTTYRSLDDPWFSQSGGGGYGSRPTTFNAPGPRGVAGANPGMISLGAVPHDMWDLYTKYTKDPSAFAKDPAYQFLFNQGMQGLNRTLAAKRLSLSGVAGPEAQKYGQDFAFQWLNKMLPEYRQGANLELERYMGPSALLPRYQAANQGTINAAGRSQASQDLIPQFSDAYNRMVAGGGNQPSPIGWGGQGGYVQPRLQNSYAQTPGGSSQYDPTLPPEYDPSEYEQFF